MTLVKKYEPRNFTDVIGQARAVAWCQSQLTRASHEHVLFCGPSGTGKTTLARIYARGILCTGTAASRPCNTCDDCTSFLRDGAHDAYREFSCPSRRGVDANQDLAELIARGAIWQDRRIVFLDEVHALSKQSFEILLKPMEHGERPAAVICATTEPDKIPRTISDEGLSTIASSAKHGWPD